MAFKVGFNDPKSAPSSYDDDATFRIADNGVLVITKGDGTRYQISPSSWSWIEDKPEPKRASFL